jgi:DNA-binding response OmpR family regulator
MVKMKKPRILVADDDTSIRKFDYDRHTVYLNSHEVNLNGTEYKLLTYLVMNAGRVIAPQLILEKVWGQEYIDKPRVLWVNISRLRRKLKTFNRGSVIYIPNPVSVI